MAEGFSEASDVGDHLEEMSLTDSQADNASEHWWNEFLQFFPNCARITPKPICLVSPGATTSESLAGRVVEKLKEQHQTTMIENEEKEEKATKSIQEWLLRLPCSFQSLHEMCQQPEGCPNMLPVAVFPGECFRSVISFPGSFPPASASVTEIQRYRQFISLPPVFEGREQRHQLLPSIFKDFKDKWKDYDKAIRKAKSDQEQSGSTWTIKMLARYVTKEDVDFKPSPHSNEEEMKDLSSQHSELMKEIDEQIHLALFCGDYKFRTECDIRMVLDAILLNVCTFKIDLRIQTEVTIKSDSLPTSKADYVMSYKNSPLAVVEAKRPGSLTKKSVAQLVLQLLSLSASQPQHLYFGLLFDGHMAIFVGVSNDKVLFFQDGKNCLKCLRGDSKSDERDVQPFIHITVVTLLWHMKNAILHRSDKKNAEDWAFSFGRWGKKYDLQY